MKTFTDDCIDSNGNPISGKPFEVPGDCTSFYQVLLAKHKQYLFSTCGHVSIMGYFVV